MVHVYRLISCRGLCIQTDQLPGSVHTDWSAARVHVYRLISCRGQCIQTDQLLGSVNTDLSITGVGAYRLMSCHGRCIQTDQLLGFLHRDWSVARVRSHRLISCWGRCIQTDQLLGSVHTDWSAAEVRAYRLISCWGPYLDSLLADRAGLSKEDPLLWPSPLGDPSFWLLLLVTSPWGQCPRPGTALWMPDWIQPQRLSIMTIQNVSGIYFWCLIVTLRCHGSPVSWLEKNKAVILWV